MVCLVVYYRRNVELRTRPLEKKRKNVIKIFFRHRVDVPGWLIILICLKKRQKRSQNELQVTGKSLRLAIKHKLKKTTGLEEIMIMKVWKFKLFGKVVSKCLRI